MNLQLLSHIKIKPRTISSIYSIRKVLKLAIVTVVMVTISVVREVVSGSGYTIFVGGSAAGAHVLGDVIHSELTSRVVVHGFNAWEKKIMLYLVVLIFSHFYESLQYRWCCDSLLCRYRTEIMYLDLFTFTYLFNNLIDLIHWTLLLLVFFLFFFFFVIDLPIPKVSNHFLFRNVNNESLISLN